MLHTLAEAVKKRSEKSNPSEIRHIIHIPYRAIIRAIITI